jgi:hypothetical protein
MTMKPNKLGLPLLLMASTVLLVVAVYFVLPALRMANVTLVAHDDPQRAAVHGMVQTAKGVPLAGVNVTWFAAQDLGDSFNTLFRGSDLTARTAADGSFQFASVPAVEGYAALADDHGRFEGSSHHVVARKGMRAEGLCLAAEAIDPARWLRGQLRRPDGSGLPFAHVQVRANGLLQTWQGPTTTDADGRFAILCPWAGAQVELLLLPTGSAPRTLGTHEVGNEVALVVGTDR